VPRVRPGFGVGAADTQVDSAHTHGSEVLESFSRHADGKIDETVISADVDVSYVAALQAGLVRDGADDVSRLHSVRMADFDAECVELRAVLGAARRSPLTPWPGVACSGPARIFVRVMERLPRGAFPRRARLGRQQKWCRTLKQAGQRRRDLDGWNVLLALDLLDERLKRLAFAALHRVGDGCLELEDALPVDLLDAGQLHRLDGLFGSSLDDTQHVAFARRDEQNRLAAASGSAGATDPVNIALRVVGNVIVDDVGDSLNVKSPCSDVGGDYDVELSLLEAGDGAFAPLLRNVTTQRGDIEATRLESFGELGRFEFRPHEYQHGFEAFCFQDPGERIQLVQAAYEPVALPNLRLRARAILNRDLCRLAHVFVRDSADRGG